MKIMISGLCGHMGRELASLAEKGCRGAVLAGGIDINAQSYTGDIRCVESLEEIDFDFDCIIDFSHHSFTQKLLEYATQNNLPLVLATTGQTDEEKVMINEASKKIPLFFAANYSLGIALLIELARKTASVMPDAEIEIIEKHHDRKIDAPSGTALAIAEAIREVRNEATFNMGRSGYGKRSFEEIGIHAVRMGNIVGEHEVLIGTQNQTISLKHEAHSRALFAEGALAAAEFVCTQKPGLYDMKSLISFSDI